MTVPISQRRAPIGSKLLHEVLIFIQPLGTFLGDITPTAGGGKAPLSWFGTHTEEEDRGKTWMRQNILNTGHYREIL